MPTPVLDGDLDNLVPLEETRVVSALFPDSTFLPVAGAGHLTVGWSQCALDLVSEFVETMHLTYTTCARIPSIVPPAVGRFPYRAKDARPAEVANSSNQISRAERKVVTVAVATAIDAFQRSIIGSGDGVGLRAGTFHTDYADRWTTTLKGCAFARDVNVSGTFACEPFDSLVADLVVSGPGTAHGTLHVEGVWLGAGPVGKFVVSGMPGGKNVSVLVPES